MAEKKRILVVCDAPDDEWAKVFVRRLESRLSDLRENTFSVNCTAPDAAKSEQNDALVAVVPGKTDFASGIPVYVADRSGNYDKSAFRFGPDTESESWYNALDDLCRKIAGDFSKVFICHAEADIEIAEKLYNDLKWRGLEPWMEKHDLDPGANTRLMVRKAVKSSAYFLALFSEHSVEKGDYHVQQKIALELLEKLPPSEIFVIPARINECDPGDTYPIFDDLKSVDLFPDYDAGLQRILKTLGIRESPDKVPEVPSIRAAVYLADVSPDLFKEREDVRRYLEQAGCQVLPETDLTDLPLEQYTAAVEETLARCTGFVQLFSHLTCRLNPARPCYGRVQFECAQKSGLPIFQWRHPDTDLEKADEKHKDLVFGESVLAVHLEEFKRETVRILSEPKAGGDESEKGFVYLNADEKDASLAKRIVSVIRNNGFGCGLAPLGEDKSERLADFREHLKISKGVIVVYCQADVKWVRRQLVECNKFASRRQAPFLVALYEQSGKKPVDYYLPKMVEIDCKACIRKEEFRPFLSALESELS